MTSGVARTRDVYAVTAALASADRRRDIDAAITATASDINVDMIGVSILSGTLNLREIASTERTRPTVYALRDYPATQAVMNGSETLEIQLADPERRRRRTRTHAGTRLREHAARPGRDGTTDDRRPRIRPPHAAPMDRSGDRARARARRPPQRRCSCGSGSVAVDRSRGPRHDGRGRVRRAAAAAGRTASPSTRRQMRDDRARGCPPDARRCSPRTAPSVSAANTSIGLPVAIVASA